MRFPRFPRVPRAENGWLLVGYTVWAFLLWAIWQIVVQLAKGGGR